MRIFSKKLKEPTITDYNRIKGKITDLINHSLNLQKTRNVIDGKSDQYWMVTYTHTDKSLTFTEVHAGNLVDAIIWFTTLQPKYVPVSSWEITESQYIAFFVANGILSQMAIEGFKPSHFINQNDT